MDPKTLTEPQIEGLNWGLKQAKVIGADVFQTDEGEPMAYVKLAYLGGLTTIMCDPHDAEKFKSFQGKWVSAGGALWLEMKGKQAKVKFEIGYIKPVVL